MTDLEFIGKLNPALFWDYNLAKIDAQKNKMLILERVFLRGNWDEYKLLFSYYGKDEIKESIVKILNFDSKTLNFLSIIFDIPKAEFTCYGKEQWME
jgi:hypothetical protein